MQPRNHFNPLPESSLYAGQQPMQNAGTFSQQMMSTSIARGQPVYQSAAAAAYQGAGPAHASLLSEHHVSNEKEYLLKQILNFIDTNRISNLLALLRGQGQQSLTDLLVAPIIYNQDNCDWILTRILNIGDAESVRLIINFYMETFGNFAELKNAFAGHEEFLFLIAKNKESIDILANAFNWREENYLAFALNAIMRNDLEALIRCHQRGINLNHPYSDGKRLLHYASMVEDADNIIDYLCQHGASLDATNQAGENALQYSSSRGRRNNKLVSLLETGAKLLAGDLTLQAEGQLNLGDAVRGRIHPQMRINVVDTSATAVAVSAPAPAAISVAPRPTARAKKPTFFANAAQPVAHKTMTTDELLELQRKIDDANASFDARQRARMAEQSMTRQMMQMSASHSINQRLNTQQLWLEMVAQHRRSNLAYQQMNAHAVLTEAMMLADAAVENRLITQESQAASLLMQAAHEQRLAAATNMLTTGYGYSANHLLMPPPSAYSPISAAAQQVPVAQPMPAYLPPPGGNRQ